MTKKQTKERSKRPQNFSVIQKQLEEVRNESFKQGVYQGKAQLKKELIEWLNKN